MAWTHFSNGHAIEWSALACQPWTSLRSEILCRIQRGERLLTMTPWPMASASDAEGCVSIPRVLVLLADDTKAHVSAILSTLSPDGSFESLTSSIAATHAIERLLWESTGWTPLRHPWLKPVRYPSKGFQAEAMVNYPFFRMEGESVHEVAVGPVHAGIIEPGHFRFQCTGEDVHHLEIQLGYQHRGLIELMERNGAPPHPRKEVLAESIAGDSVIAHACAYAGLMEALTATTISSRASVLRCIALELERIALHLGDLGGIANDIAYLTGAAIFGALRTKIINATLSLCGNRFGRGWIRCGGVRPVTTKVQLDAVMKVLDSVVSDADRMAQEMFATPGVVARLENTGTVFPKTATSIGLLGMAGRAASQPRDVRIDHPVWAYTTTPMEKIVLTTGDVYSRAYIRQLEIQQSATLLHQWINRYSEEEPVRVLCHPLQAGKLGVTMIEGWRGEVLHFAVSDAQGQVVHYGVRDPSTINWLGLAMAVRENGISDFPLCNKSFNLSYCGNDL